MPLVFVPTPLGNLRDITLRALDTLREAELIVAEDTRVARRLLSALGLPGRELWSYREQNAEGATAGILERARAGLVAVTTDAGTPGISDPGSELVAAARAAGVAVEVLPGPSAALGAAVLSGFPLARFAFEGFPPRTAAARREAFRRALALGVTTIWYESPQRIAAALADLAAVEPAATVFLLREYTKVHEEQLLGTPAAVAARLGKPVRGEIAFALAAGALAQSEAREASDAEIDALLAQGHKVSEVARLLAERGLGERHGLYARAAARKRR
ncbi:MAG TPA: 16S rRNA (cytidine(1402)-2'-O)-methyltransferase [Verrucomicrobiae bacterium]|nr:16S rRNA (cytidine(1402)-2'-O)-methyltransferase [Verrucomicrobiae bacterium]